MAFSIRRVNLSGNTGRGLAAPLFSLSREVRQWGAAQEMAAHEARENGQPLPQWKRYPQPIEQMSSDSQDFAHGMVDNYSSHNTLRKQGELTYWWLRAPAGVLPNQPGFVEIPDQLTFPMDTVKPADLDQEDKGKVIEAISAAYDAGTLLAGTPEFDAAIRVHTALTCGKPLTDAIVLHMGGTRAEAKAKVLILKEVIPEAGILAKVV